MLETLKHIVLINAYWFSLPLIGYTLLLSSKYILWLPKSIKNIAKFALRQHAIILFLLSFSVFAIIATISSIFFYVFHAPAEVAVIGYLILLTYSSVFLLYFIIKNLFKKIVLDPFNLKGQTVLTKIIFFALCIALVGDFILSLYLKSHAALGSDTFFHLTRMVSILSNGFNVDSGFFAGVPEGAYHYNVIYALYIIPSKLFNFAPSLVWEYSYGFFRLLQWVSIFTLIFHVFAYWVKDNKNTLLVASLATVSAVVCFTAQFFIAVYPSCITNIWLILLIVSFSFYEFKPGFDTALPILAFSLLITMTHPTYGLMAAIFICFMLVVKLIVENKYLIRDKKKMAIYATSIVVLMLGPIRTALLPSQLNSSQLHINDLNIISFLGMSIRDPRDLFPTTIFGLTILLLAVAMNIYMLYKTWRAKSQWSIIFCLTFFFTFLVYFPISFTILSRILPMWVIERFTSMDVLMLLLVPVGIYAIIAGADCVLRKYRITFNYKVKWLLYIGLVLAFSIHQAVPSYKSLKLLEKDNSNSYEFIDRTRADFSGVLTNDKIILTNTWASYFIPAILPVHVVAVETGHSTLTADATDRIQCQDHLLLSFDYQDLRSVKADYVVLSSYDKEQTANAGAKPYLTVVAKNQDFYVYKFIRNEDNIERALPYQPCVDYQKKEIFNT